jgi:hypothetical protein
LRSKELGTMTVSTSGRSWGSPTAMPGSGGGGGGVGGGGGGCWGLSEGWEARRLGQTFSRCPERRHLKQQMGSLQSTARCPLPKQLKQRPRVARLKAWSAAVGGRLECGWPLCRHELPSRRASKAVRRGTTGAVLAAGDVSPSKLLRGNRRSVAGGGGSWPRSLDAVTARGSKGSLRLVGGRGSSAGGVEVAEAYDVREGDPPIGLEVAGGGGGAPLTRRRGRRSGRHRPPWKKASQEEVDGVEPSA